MSTAGGSSDPYAPFYYWDAQANNWAFDYNSYYAQYGYPTQGQSGATAYPSYASGSAMPPTGYNDPGLAYAAAGTAAAAAAAGAGVGPSSGSKEAAEGGDGKKKKIAAGPKDENGNPLAGSLKRGEQRTTVVREGPNGVYEDPTLLEWDPAHKRLFVGDLGNDVTDQVLAQAFQKYASFSKARVIRKKHDHKSKGYGFVAFANPEDYLKAWKEMNGKYIGSRPCRLKAAEVNVEAKKIGYRQDRILANNVKHEEFKAKYKMGGAIGGTLRRHGVGKAWGQK